MSVTVDQIKATLKDKLSAVDVDVVDTSGGCGAAFEVYVVSPEFEGKRLLERHKMVNSALVEEMKVIHALSIKRVWTPEQKQQKQQNEAK